MIELLKQIIKDNPESIKSAVAQEVLVHDDPKSFFEDLLQHGCISGMVTSLIYYQDTHFSMINIMKRLKNSEKSMNLQ